MASAGRRIIIDARIHPECHIEIGEEGDLVVAIRGPVDTLWSLSAYDFDEGESEVLSMLNGRFVAVERLVVPASLVSFNGNQVVSR